MSARRSVFEAAEKRHSVTQSRISREEFIQARLEGFGSGDFSGSGKLSKEQEEHQVLVDSGDPLAPRAIASRILNSKYFDAVVGSVIVANALTIGAEISLEIQGKSTTFVQTCEHIFLIVYTLELGMRFFVKTVRVALEDSWVKFDSALVVFGISTQWFIFPLFGNSAALEPFLLLRVVRLLRLARMVRLLTAFKELWTLVNGLLSSLNTIMYTLIVLMMMLYCASCGIIELLRSDQHYKSDRGSSPDDDNFKRIVDSHFDTILGSMFTLSQVISMDSFTSVFRPLVLKSHHLALFFLGLILIVHIVLMNIVTAVIVNSALECTTANNEARLLARANLKKKYAEELSAMFLGLDEDGSGKLSYEEVEHHAPQALKDKVLELTCFENMKQLWDFVDEDGSGEVTSDEWCHGILEIISAEVPVEMLKLVRDATQAKATVSQLQRDMNLLLDAFQLRPVGRENVYHVDSQIGVGHHQSRLPWARQDTRETALNLGNDISHKANNEGAVKISAEINLAKDSLAGVVVENAQQVVYSLGSKIEQLEASLREKKLEPKDVHSQPPNMLRNAPPEASKYSTYHPPPPPRPEQATTEFAPDPMPSSTAKTEAALKQVRSSPNARFASKPPAPPPPAKATPASSSPERRTQAAKSKAKKSHAVPLATGDPDI